MIGEKIASWDLANIREDVWLDKKRQLFLTILVVVYSMSHIRTVYFPGIILLP